MAPTTPVAIIHAATTPAEHISRTTLRELPNLTVTNPSTLVIGGVAAQSVFDPRPFTPAALTQEGTL